MGNWRNWTVHVLLNVISQYFLVFIGSVDGTDYTGYKLYEVAPANRMQEMFLRDVQGLGYDFWGGLRNTTKVLVPPQFQDEFEGFMDNAGILTKIALENVGDIVERQSMEVYNTRRFGSFEFDFNWFPRYDEILQFMHNLVKRSSYARITSIGTSYEGRPIPVFQLDISASNPVIFVDAGIHAREWAAPVVALYLMKKVVDYEHVLARKLSIYIVPLVNPDGYEYSHDQERFWRKTRSRQANSPCFGVDGNRNFDSHWSEYGVNPDPCAATFAGYAPVTEPEVQAVQNTILTLKPTLYLTLHSFGPMLLYPWGFSHELPENWQELDDLGHRVAEKIRRVGGQEYLVGSSTNVLYLASGGSDDWAMQKAGVPLVFTMELPDYGEGFVMPAELIKPMVRETFEGFKVFLKHVCSMYYPDCESILHG